MKTKQGAVAFLAGALFAAGLCLSGMTHPKKILAFLDVTGAWDPSLALVMMGAVGVTAIGSRIATRRRTPLLGERFDVPLPSATIDAKLLAGACIFGVGWGLSGLCPGPALVCLASGRLGAVVFVAAMLAGMAVHRAVDRAAPQAGRSDAG